MAMSKDEAVEKARADLAQRLGVAQHQVKVDSVDDVDFPDANFGASAEGEVSAQMITPGWRIRLSIGSSGYEYRANRNRLRLYQFKGASHRVI